MNPEPLDESYEPKEEDFDFEDEPDEDPYIITDQDPRYRRQKRKGSRAAEYYQQKRSLPQKSLRSADGATVLTIGILSFFCLGIILGPIAWTMGNASLKMIAEGVADPSERSLVVAGRICGIIATIIYGLILLMVLPALLASHQPSTQDLVQPFQSYPMHQ